MIQLWLSIGIAAHTAVMYRPFPVQYARSVMGQNVTVCIDGRKVETTFAGKLGFQDQTASWTSVCADVRAPVFSRQMYMVRPSSSAQFGGRVAMAGNIVAMFFKSARTPDQCAGLQLAVWEAIEDGGPQANFALGRFQTHATPSVLAYAASYYAAVDEPGDVVYLQAGQGGGQSQISPIL